MIALPKSDNLIDFPQAQQVSTRSNEWYTPSHYIEAAHEVMGGIDLDPASCKEANIVVRASKFYSQRDNGLAQPWHGRIWLNPPFNQENGISLRHWIGKIKQGYKEGAIEQAIMLFPVPFRWSLWFYELWDYPMLFPRKRIHFWSHLTRKEAANIAYCVVYLGKNEQKFIDVFSKFGTVVKRVSQTTSKPVNLSLWEGTHAP